MQKVAGKSALLNTLHTTLTNNFSGWEGYSPDPVLTGIGMAETIKGIQDAGVMACAKV